MRGSKNGETKAESCLRPGRFSALDERKHTTRLTERVFELKSSSLGSVLKIINGRSCGLYR